MGRRMWMMMGDVSGPSADKERIMVEYLRRHALRTVSEEELPEAELPGAALFARAIPVSRSPGRGPGAR